MRCNISFICNNNLPNLLHAASRLPRSIIWFRPKSVLSSVSMPYSILSSTHGIVSNLHINRWWVSCSESRTHKRRINGRFVLYWVRVQAVWTQKHNANGYVVMMWVSSSSMLKSCVSTTNHMGKWLEPWESRPRHSAPGDTKKESNANSKTRQTTFNLENKLRVRCWCINKANTEAVLVYFYNRKHQFITVIVLIII